MSYQPPFQLNHALLGLVADIAELIGVWRASQTGESVPQLRRGNRIKTIQASLAIEHNTLSVEQVTALLEGKTVLGLPKEIQEVRNAFAAYDAMAAWQSHSMDDLLEAHRLLMNALVDDAGSFRQSGVGVYQGKALVHMAPPANQIPRLMVDLINWLKTTDAHPLIASCAFHYEFEFIHPFSDGNGRMGRLWQTLILSQWQPVLAFLPVETVIKAHQERYYQVLGEADQKADCTNFIVFMLETIKQALMEATTQKTTQEKLEATQENLETTQEMVELSTADKIINALKDNPKATQKQLAQQIGITPDGIKYQLNQLKKSGKIQRVGSTKAGSWQVND
jgi:Fic family protein